MKQIQLFLLLCLFAGNALSQSSAEFTHTFEHKTVGTAPARDFWVAIPMIFNTGDSGKYAELYISSQTATMIHIRAQGMAPVDRMLKPMESFVQRIETQDPNKTMEMNRCGIVQKKGIHVWSDDADLSVYLYVRNAQSAGGTAILPTTNWGLEYVIASLPANSESGDKPGEFVLVAKEDSTVVTVVPTEAIRQDGSATDSLYEAGKPFTVRLNRGEAVQYMSVNGGLPDLTGTAITSSKPLGVISAVQGAFRYVFTTQIYYDFTCEMMPPVCSWGKKYITTSNTGSLEISRYLVIASKDDQVISFNFHDQTNVVTLEKYEAYYYQDFADASGIIWESNEPFLLVYFVHGIRPAMFCVTPFENFAEEIFFQLPADSNRVDILINTSDTSTTIDGVSVRGKVSFAGETNHHVSPQYRSLRAVLNKGSHTIKTDLGACIFAYGYNSTSGYASGAPLGAPCTIVPTDTIAPVASAAGDCYHARVTVDDVHANASKLQSFIVDSLVNLQFIPDPAFVVGGLHQRFFYDLKLKDITKDGRVVVTVYDATGNRTTVSSRIDARPNPVITPATLQIPYAGTVTNFRTFELSNTTAAPMTLTGPAGLRLSSGNEGFAFVAPDLSVLPVGAKRTFLVSYSSPNDAVHRDTVLFGDECTFVTIPLASINKGVVAGTTGVDLGCIAVGTSREDVFLVDNFVLHELTVMSVAFDDAAHFTAVAPALPHIIAPEKRVGITVRYTPDAVDTNCTTARISTKELGELTAQVCGCGLGAAEVDEDVSANTRALREALRSGKPFAWLAPTPNPANLRASVKFTFGLSEATTLKLELFDLEGKYVSTISHGLFSGGEHEVSLSTNGLAAGSYFYRYTVNGISYTGKLTLR